MTLKRESLRKLEIADPSRDVSYHGGAKTTCMQSIRTMVVLGSFLTFARF